MKRTHTRIVDAPFGRLTLEAGEDGLTAIRFGGEAGAAGSESNAILDCAARQLEEYFSGARCAFSVPLRPVGTPFQRAVWQALREIPFGETATYGDIARRIGREKAFRAVGMACNRNPLPVIVPCHRVVGAKGALTGYAGGLEIKEWLLNLEKREN